MAKFTLTPTVIIVQEFPDGEAIYTETKIGATERAAYALIRNGDIENVAQVLLITADAKPEDLTALIAEQIAADIENGECVGEYATNFAIDFGGYVRPVSRAERAEQIAEYRFEQARDDRACGF